MDDQGVMTAAQETAWANINNQWPIAKYHVNRDGNVEFTCDNGDSGLILADGEWDWDH